MIFSYYPFKKGTKLMGSDHAGHHLQKAQEHVRKHSSQCHPLLFNP